MTRQALAGHPTLKPLSLNFPREGGRGFKIATARVDCAVFRFCEIGDFLIEKSSLLTFVAREIGDFPVGISDARHRFTCAHIATRESVICHS